MKDITNLISWGGSWASRFYYDDAISRHFNDEDQNFELAECIALNACGHSAKRAFANFEKLTGYKVKTEINTDTIFTKTIFDLSYLKKQQRPEIYRSIYWFERLQNHLNEKNISKKIQSINENEIKPPTSNPVDYLTNWSFPILAELFPLRDNKKNIIFIESDLAKICWKRWHLNKNDNPIWLETSNKSNVTSSRFLVWRLIHEAVHLLHLQNFPKAGKLTNPYWLLQMESVAMAAEYRFLKFIENEKFIPTPQNYYFNKFNIITTLLLGFFERTLRLEYDLEIYDELKDPEIWIQEMRFRYNLNLDIFDFSFEFHNMPSFMASYIVGMEIYLNTDSELDFLNGTKQIFDNGTY